MAKITPLRLFHNHMMIEPVLEIIGQWRPDITRPNYLRIENANIPAEEAARMIRDHSDLQPHKCPGFSTKPGHFS